MLIYSICMLMCFFNLLQSLATKHKGFMVLQVLYMLLLTLSYISLGD